MKSDKIRSLEERVRESAVFLYSKGVLKPEIGIILGSGLNDFADRIENHCTIRLQIEKSMVKYSDMVHI